MYKTNSRRKHFGIDMAATCDIAFLLLMFFIMTAKGKPWRPMKVEQPAAVQGFGDLYSGGTVLMGQGKVMLSIPDAAVRQQTLIQMGMKYNILFTPAEISKFTKIEIIGVPMSGLKRYIDGYYNEQSFNEQPGIGIDSMSNELANWVYISRKTYQSIYDRQLDMSIDADKKTGYPSIEKVISILENQKIFKFLLITTSKQRKMSSIVLR